MEVNVFAHRFHRIARSAATLGLALLLGACASVYRVDSQVQSFAGWSTTGAQVPAAPQSYRFERLPSQREGSAGESQDALENLARVALARVGWNLAEPAASPPWTVQVSGGTLRLPRAPWEDPWDRFDGGFGLYGGHGGWGSTLFLRMDMPYYERQVSLVVRQAGTARVVYETSARHDGRWASSPELWGAMLDAALRDFPAPPAGPRQVNIDLPR